MTGTDTTPAPAVTRHRPLVAVHLRRPLLRVTLACLVALAVLGGLLAHRRGPVWLDREVDPTLTGWFEGHRLLALQIADIGGHRWYLLLTTVTTLAWLLRRRPRAALLALTAPLTAVCATEYLLKPLVHRTSPYGDAFPSGHTTSIAAIAFAFVLALTLHGRPRRAVRGTPLPATVAVGVVSVVAVGVVVAVAVTLVAAGYHFVTDTVGGLLVSGITVAWLALGIDALAARRGAQPSGGTGSD